MIKKLKNFERAAHARHGPKIPLYHTSRILSIDKLNKNITKFFPKIVQFDEEKNLILFVKNT